MSMEEKLAAIAAVREYIRIFKISKKATPCATKDKSSGNKNIWGKSGRKLQMKNRYLMQTRSLSNKRQRFLLSGDFIGLNKK